MAKSDLYNDIVTKLNSDVPELNTIGFFTNQFEHGTTVTYPCCLIDYDPIEWLQEETGIQKGRLEVRFRIGHDGATTTDTAMHTVNDKVYKAIHLLSGDAYSSMTRSTEVMTNAYNNVVLWEVVYQTTFTDDSAYTKANLVEATPELSVIPVPFLDVEVTIVNVSAMAGNDGRIELNVSGGVPPYTYSWSNGATTNFISGLTTGDYSVLIRDSNGDYSHKNCNVSVFDPVQFSPALWLDPSDQDTVVLDTSSGNDYLEILLDKSQDLNTTGSNHVLNGDMEMIGSWVTYGSPVSQGRSGERTYSGTYSWKVETDGSDNDGVNQDLSATTSDGPVYRLIAKLFIEDGSDPVVVHFGSTGTVYDTTGEWIEIDTPVVSATGNLKLYFYTLAGNAATFFFDEVSLLQISGNHAAQIDSNYRFDLTTLNGRQSLLSNSQSVMSVKSDVAFENQNFSIFYVVKINDYSGTRHGGIALGTVFGTASMFSWQNVFYEADNDTALSNGTSGLDGNSVPIGDNNRHVWEYRCGSSTIGVYKDGVLQNSIVRTATIDYSSRHDLTIGGRYAYTWGFDGEMGDVLYFPTPLTDLQSNYITQNLMAKYGIPTP